jgi:hypothetical protein
VADDFSGRYGDLLTGSYDCVDRIVLNAYFSIGHHPGGFRVWWRRLHDGSEEQLDNTHLMRMAGRFARRVKAWGESAGVPVIYCKAGVRKHLIAEEYLATHAVGTGVFLILAAKAPARVWEVSRTASGAIASLAKKRAFVNHYSFHIMDPDWGHVTIKMSGHPPFGAQVILNGHEYVAQQAQAAGIGFVKEGNCFTGIADPRGLARVADTLSQPAALGRLGQVCDRWIYTACLCFGLDLAEQGMSGFRYGYSVYQAEYSRNLLFASGGQMEDLFDRIIDRTRSRLDIPAVRTVFGLKTRPHRNRVSGPPAQEIVNHQARTRHSLSLRGAQPAALSPSTSGAVCVQDHRHRACGSRRAGVCVCVLLTVDDPRRVPPNQRPNRFVAAVSFASLDTGRRTSPRCLRPSVVLRSASGWPFGTVPLTLARRTHPGPYGRPACGTSTVVVNNAASRAADRASS